MDLRFSVLVFLMAVTIGVTGQYRSIDGFGNNVENPEWGSQGDPLQQITTYGFGDGIGTISGESRMNPREISNILFDQSVIVPDDERLSDFVWVFGQFVDHDLTLVHNNNQEPLAILIPEDDLIFDPNGAPIFMARSSAMNGTGIDDTPRAYANDVTAYMDGSMVYGSDDSRAAWLRTYEGGLLKTSFNNLLPWNTQDGQFNSPSDPLSPEMDDAVGLSAKHFVAGDVRANENPLLASMHTIFVREHNRIAFDLRRDNPAWTDEQLYQEARKWVVAYIQNITFNEWLPAMGVQLPEYRGYRSDVNPQLSNEFSAAAFRLGHTLINSNLLRLQEDGEDIAGGSIGLRDAFFNPLAISLVGDIDPYIRGMATQVQQKMDCKVIDDVRNFLFGLPSAGGMDLAAININRGRERGLPDYNTIRADLGLPRIKAFDEISSDPDTWMPMSVIYETVDDIDPWVGMLAEDYMPGAMFGSTIMTIMEIQFQNLRDGDRYYYDQDNMFSAEERKDIEMTNFRDIIMRNTDIEIMQENVFKAIDTQQLSSGPELGPTPLEAVIWPNPTSDDHLTTLSIFVEEASLVDVILYNNLGSRVHDFQQLLRAGTNDIVLDLSEYQDNTAYNVMIRRGEFEYSIVRVIKI